MVSVFNQHFVTYKAGRTHQLGCLLTDGLLGAETFRSAVQPLVHYYAPLHLS